MEEDDPVNNKEKSNKKKNTDDNNNEFKIRKRKGKEKVEESKPLAVTQDTSQHQPSTSTQAQSSIPSEEGLNHSIIHTTEQPKTFTMNLLIILIIALLLPLLFKKYLFY